MVGVRKPIKIALIAALPLEFASVLVAGSNIKGLPSDAGILERFLYYGVGFMHWPGLLLGPLFKALYGDSLIVLVVQIFVGGYLGWAILIAAILYGVRFLTRTDAPPQV
jgi:hypothetical protein